MNKQTVIYYIRCKHLPSSSLFTWKCDTLLYVYIIFGLTLHAVSPFQVRTVRWALDRAAVCRVCVRMEANVWTCWLVGLCASVLKERLRSPTVKWAHAAFLGTHLSPSGAWDRGFTSHSPSCEYLCLSASVDSQLSIHILMSGWSWYRIGLLKNF